jgi:hypothetical protein
VAAVHTATQESRVKAKEVIYVKNTVDNEGFDYAFVNYSDFKDDVKDEEFHKLRVAYLTARNALAEYCGFDNEIHSV